MDNLSPFKDNLNPITQFVRCYDVPPVEPSGGGGTTPPVAPVGGEPQNPNGEVINPVSPLDTPPTLAPVAPLPPARVEGWKQDLEGDMANSPSMQKFEDTKAGFNKLSESYLNLSKLLGHEKIPVPKGPDDIEGWTRYNEAMGVPSVAEGYNLPDVEIPADLQGMSFDRGQFSEIVHKLNLTPAQASGFWGVYTQKRIDTYQGALRAREGELNGIKNSLIQEYGDAYQSNIQLGQMVINKFAADKDDNDYITALLSKDARGIRFLTKIGGEFAENKISDFKYSRHSQTPDQAQAEIDAILADPNNAYNNEHAPEEEHNKMVEYVNNLYSQIAKVKQGQVTIPLTQP